VFWSLPTVTFQSYLLVFAVAIVSGAINSVAGGGTILTFPALLSVGLSSKLANTTNTMALWPASAAAAWSFRSAFSGSRRLAVEYVVVSVLGSIVGAWLLNYTSVHLFDEIVPWLILLAAVLFVIHEPLMRQLSPNDVAQASSLHHEEERRQDACATNGWRQALVLLVQFLVGIYGGYFGAGMGIMMLAALGIMRAGDIYRMNFLKNAAGFAINLVAAILFGAWGLVEWRVAGVMAVGAIIGGYGGAGLAKKIGPRALRIVVSLIGFGLAGYYFVLRH
jgi:uncharacterized membrane protein YfcA